MMNTPFTRRAAEETSNQRNILMKTSSILTILCSAYLICVTSASAEPEPAKCRLFFSTGGHEDVFILGYKAGTATYRTSLKSLNILQVKKPKLEAVYFYEPEIFTEAMNLYRERQYTEAKTKFAECETNFKSVDSLPGNYATLGGFYKLECNRKLNELEALSAELEQYSKNNLSKEVHFLQLEVYSFWEAVRLKEWERLDLLAKEWQSRKIPAEIRVQVEYCHALALDELQKGDPSRLDEALNAYNRVLSADATASIDLVLKSVNSLLRIYSEDPGVQLAMKNWNTNDQKTGSAGYQRLMEASTLVDYYKQVGFNDIQPLSDDFKKFSEYGAPKINTPPPAQQDDAVDASVGEEDASAEDPAAGDAVEETPAE